MLQYIFLIHNEMSIFVLSSTVAKSARKSTAWESELSKVRKQAKGMEAKQGSQITALVTLHVTYCYHV